MACPEGVPSKVRADEIGHDPKWKAASGRPLHLSNLFFPEGGRLAI